MLKQLRKSAQPKTSSDPDLPHDPTNLSDQDANMSIETLDDFTVVHHVINQTAIPRDPLAEVERIVKEFGLDKNREQ